MLEESKVTTDPVPPNTRQGVNPGRMEPPPSASLESVFKKQELELLKYQFENKILVNKLGRAKIGGSETRDPNSKLNITTSHDVDLNYNTKTNYVTILEHKVAELTDQLLRDRREAGGADRTRDLEMQVFDGRKNYQDLREKYRKLKVKYAEVRKNKGMFDQTLSSARKMRAVLRAYNDTGMFDKGALKGLDLDFFDKVLDGRKDPYARPGGPEDAQAMPSGGDGDFRQILAKKDKTITELRASLKDTSRKLQMASLQLSDQVAKEELALNQRLIELKEGFRRSSKEQADRHGQELEALKAQLLTLEGEKQDWDEKAQQATAVFQQKNQELADRLFQKELEVKEAVDAGELTKQKLRQAEEKMKRAARENQSYTSRLMTSQIKTSTIAREAISRSLTGPARRETAPGQADDKVSIDIGMQELKKIEEDLNHYDELGNNFEALKEVNVNLTGQLQEQQQELDALNQRLETAEAEKRALRTKAELVQHEEETLKTRLEALTKQVEEAHHRHEEDRKAVMALKEQAMQLQGEVSAARGASVERDSELAGLRGELEAKTAEAHAAKTQLEALRGELAGAARQLGEVKGATELREAQLTQMRMESERMVVRLGELEGMQDKFERKELENSKLVDELSRKELNLKATISELHGLRAELVTLQKVIREKQEKFRGKIKDGLRRGEGEGEGAEQVSIMHNLLQMKEEELQSLRELLAASQTEAQMLEQKNALWQKKFNSQVAEQQTYVKQIRELSKIKAIFDDLKNGQGDYVSLKMAHIDLQEELAQLKEQLATVASEAELQHAGVAADKTALERLGAQVRELEAAGNESLARQLLAEEKALVLADQLDDFMRANEHLEGEVALRGRELEEAHRQLEALRSLAAERSPPAEGEEPVAERLLHAERDRLAAQLLTAEKDAVEFRAQLKECEIRLRSAVEENAALQHQTSDATNWTQLMLEKDLQIIDMARFGNEKSEALEVVAHRLAEAEAHLASTREQLSVLEERVNTTASSRNLLTRMHDTTLTALREKHQVAEHEWNSYLELTKVYGLLELAIEELEFLKSGAGDRAEENPTVRRLRAEAETLHGQLETAENQAARQRERLEEAQAEAVRLRGEKREAEERGESRYKEIERLMGQIGELSIARTQLDRANQELLAELRRMEEATHAQSADAKLTTDRQNQLKLEINGLVIDKKVLADRMAGLQEQLREREREVTKARDEYFDVQENFINATEEFLQKLDEEKERNQRLELRLVELQTQLDQRTEQAESHDRRAQKLQEEGHKLAGKIATLNDTVALLRRTSRLGEENTLGAERVVELEHQIAALEGQKTELLQAQGVTQGALDEQAARLAQAAREREELAQRIAADEAAIKDLQHRLSLKTTENEDYEELILEMRTTQQASAKAGRPDVEKLVLAEKVREYERLMTNYQEKIGELERKVTAPPAPADLRESGPAPEGLRDSKNPSKQEEMVKIVKKRLEQIKELEQKLAQANADLAALRDQNRALAAEKQTFAELGPAHEKLARKKAKIVALRAELQSLAGALGPLREAEQRRAFASEQLAQRELKFRELEQRYEALEETFQKEAFASNKSQLVLDQKTAEITRLRHELEASEGTLAALRSSHEELEARISEQAARLQQYEALLQTVGHKNEQTAEQTGREIELLRRSLDEAVTVSRTVSQRMDRERVENSQLREENERLQKDSLRSADSLVAQLAAARGELIVQKSAAERLAEQVLALEARNQTAENERHSSEKLARELELQLYELRVSAKAEEEDRGLVIEELRAEVQRLKSELTARNGEIADLENQLRAVHESAERHFAAENLQFIANQDLDGQLAELRTQNDQLAEARRADEQQIAELKRRAERLAEELREARETYLRDAEVKKALIGDLGGHVQRWKQKDEHAEQELQRLRQDSVKLEAERDLLHARVEEMREALRRAEAAARAAEERDAVSAVQRDQLAADNIELEARAAQLATQLALCQDNLNRQRLENDAQSTELLALAENIAGLESYIERAGRALTTSGEQNRALRQEVQRLGAELEERSRRADQLDAALQRLTQISSLQSNSQTQEIFDQGSTLEAMNDQVAALETKVARLAGQRDQLGQRARELSAEVARLQDERQELVQKFSSQRNSISDLQSQNSEYQTLMLKIDRDKLDFQRQRAENAELRDANESLRQQIEKSVRTLQKYKEAHDTLAVENHHLMGEIDELSAANTRLREAEEARQAEIEELAQAKQELETALQNIQNQNPVLETALEDQQTNLAEMQANIEDLKQQLELAEKASRTLQKYKEAHETLAVENHHLMGEIDELSAANTRLREAEEARQAELEELARAKQGLETALRKVQKQNSVFEGALEDQRSDLAQLQAGVESLRQQLERKSKNQA